MKLYLMQIASLQPGDIPVAAYIVQTVGKNILIDSGFPESFIRNPIKLNGELTIEMSEDDGLEDGIKKSYCSPVKYTSPNTDTLSSP